MRNWDASRVDRPAHQAAERVDLADHLSFRQPADRGVAAHLADLRRVERDQRNRAAHLGRRPRGLRARVPAADTMTSKCRIGGL